MSSNAYLTWALNQEGDLVHVDEVPNGNDCGCICPHCKSKLCAKNGGDGEKMIHHFAHISGADCVGAVESALHKMAKDILLETKCVYLPDRYDGRTGELHHFDRVEMEFYDKDTRLRPDSIGYNGDDYLWIEFKRTHAVDTTQDAGTGSCTELGCGTSHAAEPNAYNRPEIENVIRIWKKIIKTMNCLIQRRCSRLLIVSRRWMLRGVSGGTRANWLDFWAT